MNDSFFIGSIFRAASNCPNLLTVDQSYSAFICNNSLSRMYQRILVGLQQGLCLDSGGMGTHDVF